MVISVALLGFGAAGTVLAIFREKLIRHTELLLPLLMLSTGITMSLITDVSQSSFIHFDSYLLFTEYSHIGRLLITYLLFFIPFFFGALAIGLIFVKYVDNIGKIYFVNLLGSGVGGILALALIFIFFPKQLPAFISILPLVAGIIILPKRKYVLHLFFVLISVAVTGWKIFQPPQLISSQYKDINKTLLLPDAQIVLEKTTPYGVIQAASSPVLRYAPGMSLTAAKTTQIKMAMFINGDWFGAITDWKRSDTSSILDYTTVALPYVMSNRNKVLVLRSGAGIDVAHALSRNVKSIIAVEPNSIILSTLKKEFATTTDSLFYHPNVSVHNLEARTFLLTDTGRYDLITMPIVGTFGGSSGLHALQEQFILTKEAFGEMWSRLNAGGVISVTSWMDYPVRNPLKILATLIEVLEDAGVQNPQNHLAAIRSWGTITFVLTKSPSQQQEVTNIRSFCETMMFDPALLPGLKSEERTAYNQFQDNRFFDYVDRLLSTRREQFYDDYDFNIAPATDNKPYFSQYIKWTNLNRVAGFFGNRSLPFFELGYILVIVTLMQIFVASFVLILLPLFKIGWKSKNKLDVILYFTGIGLGYMFVEMVFIQRFILYFGNPVYSASAVITSLLVFSGIGSNAAKRLTCKRNRMIMIFGLIVSILLIYSLILTPVLQQTIHSPLIIKLLIVLALTGPLAFFMGMPFPTALSRLSKSDEEVVPWAWGINGCVSVISTALATIVAVEMGFMWVMLFAALAYCLPLIVQLKWR
ncbi:MAG: spermidine synthase-like protein [Segetibacter sp.]|nr:spermidine synthase-like protein [Segetibacter sp.]